MNVQQQPGTTLKHRSVTNLASAGNSSFMMMNAPPSSSTTPTTTTSSMNKSKLLPSSLTQTGSSSSYDQHFGGSEERINERLISSSLYRKRDLIPSSEQQNATTTTIIDTEVPPTESILDNGWSNPTRLTKSLAAHSSFFKPTTTTREEGMITDFMMTPPPPLSSVKNRRTPTTNTLEQSVLLKRGVFTSPLRTDPFFEVDDDKLKSNINDIVKETTWVTVFGFPPSKTSYILRQFSNYGMIINHKIMNGNFMHLQYKTRIQADKALSKNGKVFDGVLMVGVVECLDVEILRQYEKEKRLVEEKSSKKRGISAISNDMEDIQFNGGISYRHKLELPLEKKRKPESSNSFFSKVFDYVFKF